MDTTTRKLTLLFFGLIATLGRFPVRGQEMQSQAPAAAAQAFGLRQLVIVDSTDAAAASSSEKQPDSFVVFSPALWFLNHAELAKRLAEGRNRQIDDRLLSAIALVVETAVREQNFPKATAIIPKQDVINGAVRVVVELNQEPPSKPREIRLRQVLIAESIEEAQNLAPSATAGFLVLSPRLSFLNQQPLSKALASAENTVLNDRLLVAIASVIESNVRAQDLPAATAIIPPQNIADGTLRVAVLPGKFREIKFQGNRWFSQALLKDKLHVEQGEIIRLSELDRAVSWTNNNPFRRVRVHIDPIPNTGEANLIVGVQERLPLRLVTTVDNGGTDLIGRNRYTAAVSYANLWGRDHQASYQFITTNKSSIFQAHGVDYRVPLPWRHYVQLSGSYFTATPDIYDGFFNNEGETVTGDVRYTLPLRAGVNSAEAFAAFSFKQSNNNLTWDPTGDRVSVFATKTDVFQFSFGGSAVWRDKRGAWALAATVTASPGGINSRNTDRAFDAGRYGLGDSARIGARATYAYATLSAQRLLTFAPGWDLTSRAIVQVSQANLLSSEQLTIGGASTVRGFSENIFAGDHGYVFSNELYFPTLQKALPYLSKHRGPLDTRFLAFVDLADTFARHRYPVDGKRASLASAGLGMRMNFATNFSLTADYGWQLSDLPYPVDQRSRAHLKATLAF